MGFELRASRLARQALYCLSHAPVLENSLSVQVVRQLEKFTLKKKTKKKKQKRKVHLENLCCSKLSLEETAVG
jgi:hypothetical protein